MIIQDEEIVVSTKQNKTKQNIIKSRNWIKINMNESKLYCMVHERVHILFQKSVQVLHFYSITYAVCDSLWTVILPGNILVRAVSDVVPMSC